MSGKDAISVCRNVEHFSPNIACKMLSILLILQPFCKLRSLHYNISEADIRALFSPFGAISKVDMSLDAATGNCMLFVLKSRVN